MRWILYTIYIYLGYPSEFQKEEADCLIIDCLERKRQTMNELASTSQSNRRERGVEGNQAQLK